MSTTVDRHIEEYALSFLMHVPIARQKEAVATLIKLIELAETRASLAALEKCTKELHIAVSE